MLKETYPYYLGNKPVAPNSDLVVLNKFTGEVATRTALADRAAIDKGIALAEAAAKPMRELPSFKRAEILHHAVKRFTQRHEELSKALCIEAGKPINDARGEVTRLIDTFNIAAEEAVRFGGEYMPLDISPRAAGYESITKRVPIGPCSFISPFNFPLNLAAHKVAPAIAAGCPFVLKPASLTPIGALIIGEVLAETDLPEGAFSILPVSRDGAALFTTDDRIKLLSFTGSPEVGWKLKAQAGKKKVVLELGGNAACIVEPDADVAHAADRIAFGAFYQSGQSCISVQRVLIHESKYKETAALIVDRAKRFTAGDPLDEKTTLGPIISEKEAKRIESWINEAVAHGAKVLTGGKRNGLFVEATVLDNVDPTDDVSSGEVFGPVVVLAPYQTIMIVDSDAPLRKQWASALETAGYGLICGVSDPDTAAFYLQKDSYDIIFVDVTDHVSGNPGLDFVARIRQQGFGGLLVVVTEEPTADLCYRAARIGANDFLVKGPHLSIATHATRLTRGRHTTRNNMWRPETILATGLFTSLGVTHCELKVLEEFARGFPKQQDIAARLEKDNVYVRKVFSKIYKKLEGQMAVKNQAQLSHLLTICSLFD